MIAPQGLRFLRVGRDRHDRQPEREGHEDFPMHATTSVRTKKWAGRTAERRGPGARGRSVRGGAQEVGGGARGANA